MIKRSQNSLILFLNLHRLQLQLQRLQHLPDRPVPERNQKRNNHAMSSLLICEHSFGSVMSRKLTTDSYPTYDVTRATTAQDIIEIPQGSDLSPEDDLVAARGIPVFKPSMEEFAVSAWPNCTAELQLINNLGL
jgi:hypothetical protein